MPISSKMIWAAAVMALCGAVSVANAAQQCFTTAGTYGAVTVTESAGCAANNPFNYSGRTGFALTITSTCTLGFSHPVTTSSITVDIDGNGTGDVTTISTNAGAYSVIGGDITAPLVPAGSPGSISASGGSINGNGSGTFRFTNAPPASITSLSLSIVAGAGGTFYRVCADDGAVTASSATPVPTLSEWGGIILFFLVAGIGGLELLRRKGPTA